MARVPGPMFFCRLTDAAWLSPNLVLLRDFSTLQMQPGSPQISFFKGHWYLTDAAWHSLPLKQNVFLIDFGILRMQPGTHEISFFKEHSYLTDAAWHF